MTKKEFRGERAFRNALSLMLPNSHSWKDCNKFCVMEAGLSNLTQNELPVLIHKNGTTQRWLLVRLEQPNSAGH